jgi:membrane protease YdiL (CAAX protease family)
VTRQASSDLSRDTSRVGISTARSSATAWEAVIVLGLPTFAFLERHLRALWTQSGEGRLGSPLVFDDADLLTTLAVEVAFGAILLWWLARRGWRVAPTLGRATPRDLLRGAFLWCATFAIVRTVNLLLAASVPQVYQAAHDAPLQGTLSWWVYLAALAINPVFEEVLWLGYAVPTLGRVMGIGLGALVSIGLRVAVHLPQGTPAFTSILPVAVVWTAYFLWQRRLWPVVIAHVINSAFGLGDVVRGVG